MCSQYTFFPQIEPQSNFPKSYIHKEYPVITIFRTITVPLKKIYFTKREGGLRTVKPVTMESYD